ncbi:DUF6541 family protein [Rothia sp. ZJ1223]|uniref:DUF6541 family protein n=1 Tax=Rothia sp. ZJ1223 TaxID=2811098 RepID=UPI00195630C1|nr:DUF6541 family protein [Rothia sp. ZJ1223]MBM7051760.1 hypothetical protein [Rothia sp. ZJ1223]
MWINALLPAALALVVVFAPGLMVTIAARLKGFDAFAIAPAISVAVVAGSAILAPFFGFDWALWLPFVLALFIAVLAALVVWGFDSVGLLDAPSRRRLNSTVDATPMSWSFKGQLWHYLAWALALILLVRNMTNSLGNPEWISQTWDNIFHQNAIRYIADHGNGSALFINSMVSANETPAFYPAAWHDIVSLVFMNTEASTALSTNAVALVVSAVVWPLSALYMLRSIFPLGRFALMLSAVALASFPAYPYLLVFFGVLYPNLLGYSLVPVGIGMMAQLFRVGLVRHLATVQTVYLGIFVTLGTAIAHPNAVMSMLVLVTPIFATRLVMQIVSAVQKQTPAWVAVLQVLGLLALFAVVYYLWGVVRPPKEAGDMWHPYMSQGGALGELLSHQVLSLTKPLWLVSTLFVVGAYLLVTAKNRLYWLFGTWVVLAYFYIAVRSLDWEDGRYDVVGVWYHDSYRVAALIPLVVLPFIAYLAQHLAEWAQRIYAGWTVRRVAAETASYRADTRLRLLPAAGVVAVLVVGGALQTSAPLTKFIDSIFWQYAPEDESPLLGPDEITIFEHLDDYVEEDEKIVVQAFNGGPLAYAYTGREVSAYHALWDMTDDEAYVYQNLNAANEDPKVCEILERENYRYYLEFGHIEVNEADHSVWYPGFEEIVENNVVEETYRAGGAKLYKITACD